MAKKGLRLEKTARGYEVQNERFNWIGDVEPTSEDGEWEFIAAPDQKLSYLKLGQVRKLIKGLKEVGA